jgi:UDP-3-O-[3-hydroxymyristoyl] N-acetylglucosamine deacetylase
MIRQRTLKNVIRATGVGLHTGEKVYMTLRPAAVDTGIVFRRVDLSPAVEIRSSCENVGDTRLSTTLVKGNVRIATIEHLLSAIAGLGIDNAYVDLSAPEVPIMDGSSAPFIYLVQEAGVKVLSEPRRYLKVTEPVTLTRGDKQITLYPSDQFKVTYTISFDHPLLRHQTRTMVVNEDTFIDEIAPARTFTFLKEVEMLRQNGLALGGSLDNAIVIGDTGVLNSSLRFEDEFVRHKILDLVGDFALLGHPIVAHAVVHRGGHALHTAMAAELLEQRNAWELVAAPSSVTGAGAAVPAPAVS